MNASLGAPEAPAALVENPALEKLLVPPPLPEEDWQIEADLRSVQRLVANLRPVRLDSQAARPGAPHLPTLQSAANTTAQTQSPKPNLAAWSLLSLGLAAFACGAVLIGWSFAADRDDLWTLGMPMALGGQVGLILGLIFQLDGLWHSNRKTLETLSTLDDELSRVRQATTLLSTTHSTSGQSFYSHMAEGASPQLLLADLKGQLDLVAQQLAAQRR